MRSQGTGRVRRRRDVVACVADPAIADHLSVDDDVVVLRWDGVGAVPDGAEEVTYLVPPHTVRPLDPEQLAQMPSLRYIQLLSRGVDHWVRHVPTGVTLCNGGDLFALSTAELALSGILHHLHELPAIERARSEERWERRTRRDLASSRVLILGAGTIASRLRLAIEVLGGRVTVVGRRAREGVVPVERLSSLLPHHDIVVVAVPLTGTTRAMVGAQLLALLPDGALLVNVSRGEVVVTDALVAELSSGRIHAFLDVVDPEPLPPGHPLWRVPNLLLTPHMGGETRGWKRRASDLVSAQLRLLALGHPPSSVVSAESPALHAMASLPLP